MSQWRRSPVVLILLTVAGGCGGTPGPNLVDPTATISPPSPTVTSTTVRPSDSESDTSSSTDAATTTVPPTGEWVDVTRNLAGLQSECGTVSGVASSPHDARVVAGVALNGLWVDDGVEQSWRPLGTGVGSAAIDNRMSSVVFDPGSTEQFWESGSYGEGGVYRTTDGGSSFVQLGEIKHLDALSVDFSDPDRMTMLAGAHERPALYRTINGGATWDDVSTALPPGIGNASQPLILDSSTYLLGTNSGTNSGVFRTTDGGATWSQVYDGGVYGIPTQLDDGTLLWMKEQGTGLVRSTDQGVSWAETVGPGLLAQGWTLAPLGDGSVAAIGRTTIVVTPDAGISWEVLGPRFPDDPPFGLTYSAAQDAIYIWNFTCDQVVPSESIHRLDLSPDD